MRAFLALILLAAATFRADAQQAFPAQYPEGPIWIGETLYWADLSADRVMRLDRAGPVPFIEYPGCGPTAIAPYRETDLIVLCHIKGALLHIRADGSTVGVIEHADGTKFRDPNDAYSDGNGGVWFTDPGTFWVKAEPSGRLYHLGADGKVRLHADGLAYGNGVYFDAARNRLLLSEHLGRRVLSYPLTADGLGTSTVLFDLDKLSLPMATYAEAGPDGLEIGPDGTLWVAEYGAKRILGWRDDEGLVAALEVDPVYVTNIAFGPNGLAALTGTDDNSPGSNEGAIWIFEARHLGGAN